MQNKKNMKNAKPKLLKIRIHQMKWNFSTKCKGVITYDRMSGMRQQSNL